MSVTANQVLSAPLVLAVRLYQRFVSPMSSPTCRFYPSCSAYAVTALTRFGPVRGGWLAIRRLGRCHPWNPGGVDPVPMTWAERNDWKPEYFRPSEDAGDELRDPGADVESRSHEPSDGVVDHDLDSDLDPETQQSHEHSHEHSHPHSRRQSRRRSHRHRTTT